MKTASEWASGCDCQFLFAGALALLSVACTNAPAPVQPLAGSAAVATLAGAQAVATAGSAATGGPTMAPGGSARAGTGATVTAGAGATGAVGSAGFTGSAGTSSSAQAGTAAVSGGAGGTSAAAAGAGGGSAGTGATANDCPTTALKVGDNEFMIDSKNGQKYSYILSVPKSVDLHKRVPLVVHWHALSSDPEEARMVTSIDAKVEAAGVIAVFPRSPDKSWDVDSCCTGTVGGVNRDEEVFARELVKEVQSKACIDPKRIYTNGFSNGGMISQMLTCKMTDVFAAAAPMGSTLTIPATECKPARPMPIILINGTADPLVGYSLTGFAGGLSAIEDVQFWVDTNKCTGTPEMEVKGKATCKRYKQCAAGVEVAACAVEGMGHCVPGMKAESASNCLTKSGIALGMPNDDIDALQMDMDFLLRFTLP